MTDSQDIRGKLCCRRRIRVRNTARLKISALSCRTIHPLKQARG